MALQTGTQFLQILSPFYFVVSAKLVADGILRGAGLMGRFMSATFTDLLLRVALALVLSKTALGLCGVWLSWPCGWVTATLLSLWFYRTGPWFTKASDREEPAEECGEALQEQPAFGE